MISPTERLIAKKDGAIGWLIFNHPARRNALSLDMWAGIGDIIEHYEADPAIRVVVLRGVDEKVFVSGADISEFEEKRSTAESIAHYDGIASRAFTKIETCKKPTIAMIQGFCIGGGIACAQLADIRITGESGRFGIPATRLGLGYGWGGVKRLTDLVGPAYAKEILLTARQFSAAEAHAMGIVNRVVPDAELESFVRSYCAMIAENAPLTMELVKESSLAIAKPSSEIDAKRLDAMVTRCMESEDYKEGRRAFMEKRRPNFQGR
jgi:enoyl-CoA hydratase